MENKYNHYRNSVGNGLRNVQITTKYRYKMMGKDKIATYCKIAIEETCKRHKVEIVILKVLPEHSHMMVDIPRTMSDAGLMQILKGLSSFLLFRICPDLRKRYPKGHFWNDGYFCEGVGVNDFEKVYKYIENQEEHHGLA